MGELWGVWKRNSGGARVGSGEGRIEDVGREDKHEEVE
jgi:hypothetical protein